MPTILSSAAGHHMKMFCTLVSCILPAAALILNGTTVTMADASDQPSSDPRASGAISHHSESPYCGISSLYVCLHALGYEVDAATLIDPRFVTSYRGSTVDDILRAAKELRVEAEVFDSLTVADIVAIDSPTILHTRSNSVSGDFNHWVAYLGREGDRLRIVDPPHSLQLLSEANLLASWDGKAIVLGGNKSVQSFMIQSRIQLFALVVMVPLAIYIAITFIENLLGPPSVLHQMMAILGTTLLLAGAYHTLSDVGFSNNSQAVADVARRFTRITIPEISLEDLANAMKANELFLVDARSEDDYRYRALPGSVNIPVDSTATQREQVILGLPRTHQVVVYCQSDLCSYADEIAQYLKLRGFDNVSVFRGGFEEWEHHGHEKDGRN